MALKQEEENKSPNKVAFLCFNAFLVVLCLMIYFGKTLNEPPLVDTSIRLGEDDDVWVYIQAAFPEARYFKQHDIFVIGIPSTTPVQVNIKYIKRGTDKVESFKQITRPPNEEGIAYFVFNNRFDYEFGWGKRTMKIVMKRGEPPPLPLPRTPEIHPMPHPGGSHG